MRAWGYACLSTSSLLLCFFTISFNRQVECAPYKRTKRGGGDEIKKRQRRRRRKRRRKSERENLISLRQRAGIFDCAIDEKIEKLKERRGCMFAVRLRGRVVSIQKKKERKKLGLRGETNATEMMERQSVTNSIRPMSTCCDVDVNAGGGGRSRGGINSAWTGLSLLEMFGRQYNILHPTFSVVVAQHPPTCR